MYWHKTTQLSKSNTVEKQNVGNDSYLYINVPWWRWIFIVDGKRVRRMSFKFWKIQCCYPRTLLHHHRIVLSPRVTVGVWTRDPIEWISVVGRSGRSTLTRRHNVRCNSPRSSFQPQPPPRIPLRTLCNGTTRNTKSQRAEGGRHGDMRSHVLADKKNTTLCDSSGGWLFIILYYNTLCVCSSDKSWQCTPWRRKGG